MTEPQQYLQDLFETLSETSSPSQATIPDEALVQELISSSALLEGGASFFWLLDYAKREPVFVSAAVQEVLGYSPGFLKQGGMVHWLSLVPAEDRELLKKIYADIHAYYQRVPPAEKGLYRFDFNYRLQRADYRLISVLQQLLFAQTTPRGVPLLELSVLTDFSTYKSTPVLQLQIYKLQDGAYKKVYACQYDESLEKLTEREKEVLGLIAQGLTDKETADKMCLSLHTVKTHRKNILTKTNSRNAAEAVNKFLAAAGTVE